MDQKTEQINPITKDTNIGEIVDKYPEVIDTLTGFGVHCVGCHVSPFESIEMGFKGHGMTDQQVEEAVRKLNEVIKKNGSIKTDEPEQKEFDFSKATLDVTDKAAEKIKAFIEQEKKQGLRISVVPGGCSGFKYDMTLDDKALDDDIVIEEKGIKIFVDKSSMVKLNGSNVDFVDSLQGAGFKISNSGSASSCGCGESFG